MEKVHIHAAEIAHVDSGSVIWQLIELRFGLSPIITRLPVLGQAFDICKRRTVIPVRILKLEGDQKGVTASLSR